jgi:phosphatidylglycerol:prolipoprotein diacylglycerol transferase
VHPILFETSWGPVHAYGAAILVGTLVTMPGAAWDLARRGISPPHRFPALLDLYIALFLGTVIGGRALHVLTHPGTYLAAPLEALRPEPTGFVFLGSLAGIAGALAILGRRGPVPAATLFDVLGTWLPAAHAFGRLGCYLAGCCHGAPTTAPCGVRFPPGSVAYADPGLGHDQIATVAVHPTQLYEAFALLVLWVVLVGVRRRRAVDPPWQAFSRYAVGYGAIRLVTEVFRGDAARGSLLSLRLPGLAGAIGLPEEHALALSTSQVGAVMLLGLGIVLLARGRRCP